MKEIKFNNYPSNIDNGSVFVAHLSGSSKDKNELLVELSAKLKFPDYFGSNWDSLYDCLRDFNWIKQKDIVLVHDKIPLLEYSDLKMYVQILNDALKSWEEGEEHSLEIIFPKESENTIQEILRDI